MRPSNSSESTKASPPAEVGGAVVARRDHDPPRLVDVTRPVIHAQCGLGGPFILDAYRRPPLVELAHADGPRGQSVGRYDQLTCLIHEPGLPHACFCVPYTH